MRLNPEKIDERIRKLQEIKRIASDPEMVQMLFEFIDLEETRHERPRRIGPPSAEEVGELVNRVVRSVGANS
jgi:hypothetical protein